MKVTINDKLHEVPFDLSDITLGNYLQYYEQYGRDLDKQLSELSSTDYAKLLQEKGFAEVTTEDVELHQFIDIDNHIDHEALSWFSFWTKHDFFEVKNEPAVTDLLAQYRLFRHLSSGITSQGNEDFPQVILWREEQWMIQDFKVTPGGEMCFNEIITSKEVMRQVHAIGKGKWDALPYLCAVFFRKKGEAFNDTLIKEEGERMKLMQELPLLHALQVAFFLSICVNIWSNTLVSSPGRAEAAAALS